MSPTFKAFLMTSACVLGLAVSCLTVYTFAESRIATQAAEKQKIDMSVQSLEINLTKLQQQQWTDKIDGKNDLSEIKKMVESLKDRTLNLELKK